MEICAMHVVIKIPRVEFDNRIILAEENNFVNRKSVLAWKTFLGNFLKYTKTKNGAIKTRKNLRNYLFLTERYANI